MKHAPDPNYPPCLAPHHNDAWCPHCEGLRDGADWVRDQRRVRAEEALTKQGGMKPLIAAARLDAARRAFAYCIAGIKNTGSGSIQWIANDWLNMDDAALARIVGE